MSVVPVAGCDARGTTGTWTGWRTLLDVTHETQQVDRMASITGCDARDTTGGRDGEHYWMWRPRHNRWTWWRSLVDVTHETQQVDAVAIISGCDARDTTGGRGGEHYWMWGVRISQTNCELTMIILSKNGNYNKKKKIIVINFERV